MKKGNRASRFAVIILFLFFIWILAAPRLASCLIVEKPLENADAIFVLSGSATYIERTQKAAALYKQRLAPKIFLTNDGTRGGWNQNQQKNPYFVELARMELVAQKVPENAIEVLSETVAGTDDEAELFVKTAREQNLKSILLVTSAYHTRRTLWTFEKVLAESGLKTEIGIASAPFGQQTPSPNFWWLSPFGWNLVAGEYVKSFYYWVYY
ncbi:MAG: YdcF family protein [Pyrinomonadaceae bacterium]|nr:YdcF family protein [Pyrinomonadaceae bacterium]